MLTTGNSDFFSSEKMTEFLLKKTFLKKYVCRASVV